MRHQERVRHIRGVTNRERMVAGVLLAATVALVIALVSGGSEDAPDPELQTPVAAPAPDASDGPDRDPGHRGADRRPDPDPDPKADELPEGPSGPAPSSGPERQAAGTLREYIRALNRGDGERLCAVFEPGALDGFDFPRERGSCAASVAASLGYRDPRGLPVWERSEVTDAIAVEISGTEARVVATVFTLYADVREPSIEDDIVYMREADGAWLIVKPSATLYRAVGIADVPPSVIAPPG